MTIKVKNYVVSESKTFTYVVKGFNNDSFINLISALLRGNILFDFRMNPKSNTLSFCVRSLEDFETFKRIVKRYSLIKK